MLFFKKLSYIINIDIKIKKEAITMNYISQIEKIAEYRTISNIEKKAGLLTSVGSKFLTSSLGKRTAIGALAGGTLGAVRQSNQNDQSKNSKIKNIVGGALKGGTVGAFASAKNVGKASSFLGDKVFNIANKRNSRPLRYIGEGLKNVGMSGSKYRFRDAKFLENNLNTLGGYTSNAVSNAFGGVYNNLKNKIITNNGPI